LATLCRAQNYKPNNCTRIFI